MDTLLRLDPKTNNVRSANIPDREGVTPVLLASMQGCAEAVTALVAHKADVNHKAHSGLDALLLAQHGGHAEAVAVLREELDRQPGHPEIGLLLAWTLATSPDSGVRDGAEALGLAGQSREGVGDRWDVLDTLAAAHAETGDFDQAVELARRALELARGLEVSAELSTRLGLYEAGTAYREPR